MLSYPPALCAPYLPEGAGQGFPKVFDYLHDDKDIFEKIVLEKLSDEGQLMSFRHEGFWQCMDSMREKDILTKLWESGKAPWKKW